MILDLLFVVGGIALLVIAADHFVIGAARIAAALSMPPVVIGAVVMGFGTSAPELVVSVLAANRGDLALGVGNVIGSNVANLSLVLATAAMVATLLISPGILRREGPLSFAATVLFAAVVWDGRIARWEGVVLGVLLVAVVAYLVSWGRNAPVVNDEIGGPHRGSLEALRLVLGLIGTVVAAQAVVSGASGLADRWGLSGGFIGFSLVALGTSLPELVTAVASARRGQSDLIVGNVLGSNIFNSLAVGAGMGLVGPGPIGDELLTSFGVAAMVVISALALVLAWFGRRLSRIDGVVLLVGYVVTMAVLGVGD